MFSEDLSSLQQWSGELCKNRAGKGRQFFLCILLVRGVLWFKNFWVHVVSISSCRIALIDHSYLALFLCVYNWYTLQEEITFSVCFDLAASLFQAKSVNIFTVRSGEKLFPCRLCLSQCYIPRCCSVRVRVLSQKSPLLLSIFVQYFTRLPALGCAVVLRNVPGSPEPRAVPGDAGGAGGSSRPLLQESVPKPWISAVPGGSTRGQICLMLLHGDGLPGKPAHVARGWA